MPTTYAHYYFGNQVIDILPLDYQRIIKENRDIYNFGVHGPDIFFYYHGYKNNDVVSFAYQMHNIPGKIFFQRCKEEYKNHPEKDMMMSYILGFLTHYTFDSVAHSYVERKREYSKISHNKVEAEYDRYLIIKNGYSPIKFDRTKSLKPNKEISKVMSYFFDYDENILYQSTKWQVLLLKTLSAKNNLKRNFLNSVLDFAKISEDVKDLIIGEYEDPICADSNLRMDKLRVKALELYPILFNNLINFFEDKEELIEYFDHDFDRWPNYNELPVLSYEEEKNYIL